jgi:hypothetical protein
MILAQQIKSMLANLTFAWASLEVQQTAKT